ncbi:MAG: ribosome biogenesis protein [Nitrososphaeraceae archaeon]
MISLVIAEAAIETVPTQIIDHPSVKNYAQRTGRASSQILLDRSYHHSAMVRANLNSGWKRGRPDIVHFALMEALSTPLFFSGRLNVYLHTINDKLIFIGENLRIPKSYFRFEGLMIDLFEKKVIKSHKAACNDDDDNNNILLRLHDDMTFEEVIKKVVKPAKLIGLSKVGIQSTAQAIVAKNISEENTDCAFIVGGFAKGHFSNNTTASFNRLYSISHYSLEAHVVIARLLYECENSLHI